jgi:hypothetical protein
MVTAARMNLGNCCLTWDWCDCVAVVLQALPQDMQLALLQLYHNRQLRQVICVRGFVGYASNLHLSLTHAAARYNLRG